MSYETGRDMHSYESDGKFDFGGVGNSTQKIAGFPKKKMKVESVYLQVAEAFVTPTTEAEIQFGDGTTADKFGKIVIPHGTKVGGLWFTPQQGTCNIKSDDTEELALGYDDAEEVTLTYKPGTGAGLAGQAHVKINVKFY